MKRANRGFFCDLAAGADDIADAEGACAGDDSGSVFSFIRVSVEVFGEGFVDHGLADHIFLAGPSAKVQQFAALAAERELGIRVRVGRFTANWTVEFHGLTQIRLTRMI